MRKINGFKTHNHRKRENFPKKVRYLAAKKVGYLCSNPTCRKWTVVYNGKRLATPISIGEGAHICAARPKGKRYDKDQTEKERRSVDNCIWLCPSCHTLIDLKSTTQYTVDLLRKWKRDAEYDAANIIPFLKLSKGQTLDCDKIEGIADALLIGGLYDKYKGTLPLFSQYSGTPYFYYELIRYFSLFDNHKNGLSSAIKSLLKNENNGYFEKALDFGLSVADSTIVAAFRAYSKNDEETKLSELLLKNSMNLKDKVNAINILLKNDNLSDLVSSFCLSFSYRNNVLVFGQKLSKVKASSYLMKIMKSSFELETTPEVIKRLKRTKTLVCSQLDFDGCVAFCELVNNDNFVFLKESAAILQQLDPSLSMRAISSLVRFSSRSEEEYKTVLNSLGSIGATNPVTRLVEIGKNWGSKGTRVSIKTLLSLFVKTNDATILFRFIDKKFSENPEKAISYFEREKLFSLCQLSIEHVAGLIGEKFSLKEVSAFLGKHSIDFAEYPSYHLALWELAVSINDDIGGNHEIEWLCKNGFAGCPINSLVIAALSSGKSSFMMNVIEILPQYDLLLQLFMGVIRIGTASEIEDISKRLIWIRKQTPNDSEINIYALKLQMLAANKLSKWEGTLSFAKEYFDVGNRDEAVTTALQAKQSINDHNPEPWFEWSAENSFDSSLLASLGTMYDESKQEDLARICFYRCFVISEGLIRVIPTFPVVLFKNRQYESCVQIKEYSSATIIGKKETGPICHLTVVPDLIFRHLRNVTIKIMGITFVSTSWALKNEVMYHKKNDVLFFDGTTWRILEIKPSDEVLFETTFSILNNFIFGLDGKIVNGKTFAQDYFLSTSLQGKSPDSFAQIMTLFWGNISNFPLYLLASALSQPLVRAYFKAISTFDKTIIGNGSSFKPVSTLVPILSFESVINLWIIGVDIFRLPGDILISASTYSALSQSSEILKDEANAQSNDDNHSTKFGWIEGLNDSPEKRQACLSLSKFINDFLVYAERSKLVYHPLVIDDLIQIPLYSFDKCIENDTIGLASSNDEYMLICDLPFMKTLSKRIPQNIGLIDWLSSLNFQPNELIEYSEKLILRSNYSRFLGNQFGLKIFGQNSKPTTIQSFLDFGSSINSTNPMGKKRFEETLSYLYDSCFQNEGDTTGLLSKLKSHLGR